MDFVLRDLYLKEIPIDRFHDDPNGRLIVWEERRPNFEYYMGVDIGSGKGLSNSVIHVLRKSPTMGTPSGAMLEPDEQVAEFACNFLDPHELAPIINYVGHLYYSDVWDLPAQACVEINNFGEGCQYDLMTTYGYPHLFIGQHYNKTNKMYTKTVGWVTNLRTRKDIILWGEHQIKTNQWIINSPWFIDEMADFQVDRLMAVSNQDPEVLAATARHARGALDDRLMAGFIAEWCANVVRPTKYNPAAERSRHAQALREAQMATDRGERPKDFQNSAMTWDEMMNRY